MKNSYSLLPVSDYQSVILCVLSLQTPSIITLIPFQTFPLFLLSDHKFYSPPHFISLFYFGNEFPHHLNLYIFIRSQRSTGKVIPSFLTAIHHSESGALCHYLGHEILLVVSVCVLTFQAVIFHCPYENLPMNVMYIVSSGSAHYTFCTLRVNHYLAL